MSTSIIIYNVLNNIVYKSNISSDGWVFVRDGIERKPLAESAEKGLQIDLMRIKPNFSDRPHFHDGFEWVYILEGSLVDEKGVHRKGDFIVNTTEGVHQPSTGPEGCMLLIVWCGSVRPAE